MAFLLGISSTKYGKSCGDEVPPNFHGKSHEDLIEWLKSHQLKNGDNWGMVQMALFYPHYT